MNARYALSASGPGAVKSLSIETKKQLKRNHFIVHGAGNNILRGHEGAATYFV